MFSFIGNLKQKIKTKINPPKVCLPAIKKKKLFALKKAQNYK